MIRKADIITTEVIGCYLLSIAEEVGIAMIKAAFSPNIKERRDCSAALLDKNGGVIAQASHIPMHLGSLFGAAETILNKYSVKNIEEGDVFIVNDGYVGGGTHLPDINIVTPIFYENQLMAFAGNIGHHLDVGGRVPGSTIASSQSIFEEGIRIPPVKILKKGVFQDDLMDLITLNTRDPIERTMDLEVQIMANEIAKPRMKELIERYGPKTILDAIDALNNYSERRMKSIIKYLEDGEYEFTSILDDDGSGNEAQIRVRITVDGKNLDINFSGTSPQSPGALNVTRSALLSTVYYAVKSALDPTIPINYGFSKCIKVITEKGTIVNPNEPAAIAVRTDTCQKIAAAILGALFKVLPKDRAIGGCHDTVTSTTFSGYNARKNNTFVHLETIGGGFGARPTKDGLDGVQVHITNTSNLPVESFESENPLYVEQYKFVEDSGGAGKYRGGLGLQRDVRILVDDTKFINHADTFRTPAWGIFGGHPGRVGKMILNPGTDDEVMLKSKGEVYTLKKGDCISIRTPGGGGYGDPKERDPKSIVEDLENGKISTEEAGRAYGVDPRRFSDERR